MHTPTDPQPSPEADAPPEVFLSDVSYFSGKFETYLRFKRLPYRRVLVDDRTLREEVYPNTGLMQVPAMRCVDGSWLHDTTTMIEHLEARHPERSLLPEDPALCFLAWLIEDMADEWLWRPAMWWRWAYPETRRVLEARLGAELFGRWPLPARLSGWLFGLRQRHLFLRGDGVRDAQTRTYTMRQYLELLDALEAILISRPFLLGERPSVADVGLMGPLFRHFALDPDPQRVMLQRAPGVYAWVGRMWNAKTLDVTSRTFAPPDYPHEHPGWRWLMTTLRTAYLPSLTRNARAWHCGERFVDLSLDGVVYQHVPVRRYRVYCLEQLQRRWRALSKQDRTRVARWLFTSPAHPGADLMEHHILALDEAVPASGLDDAYTLPIRRPARQLTWSARVRLAMLGTPRDMPDLDH